MTELVLDPAALDGIVFDMDGVVTDTARIHEAAWASTFDAMLAERGDPRRFSHEDYREHVDGRPRREGVEAFLRSRGIAPEPDLVDRLAAEKNAAFRQVLAERGATPLPGARRLLDEARAAGLRVGLFTASRNAAEVLASAGFAEAFDARVDGVVSAEQGLAGKPAPDQPLALAARLSVDPARCALFEDAAAGVRAGKSGGFRPVVGVAATSDADRLRGAGADEIVGSLDDVRIAGAPR